MNVLTNINMNQNEVQNVVLQKVDKDPYNSVPGQIWFNVKSNKAMLKTASSVESLMGVKKFVQTVVMECDDVVELTHNLDTEDFIITVNGLNSDVEIINKNKIAVPLTEGKNKIIIIG